MLTQALVNLRPNCIFTIVEDMITSYQSELPQPTKEELDTEIKRLKDEYSAKQYQRDRVKEYNKLNQFAMQYDDVRDSTTTWVDAINEIKAKYQKPIKEAK